MAGTTGSIGSGARELERVVLPNAVADELLEQFRTVRAGGHVIYRQQRMPGVLEDDQKTLGRNLLVASFARRGAEQLAQLRRMASVRNGASEDGAQRAERVRVERGGRRGSIKGHHAGRPRLGGGKRRLRRFENLSWCSATVKLDG